MNITRTEERWLIKMAFGIMPPSAVRAMLVRRHLVKKYGRVYRLTPVGRVVALEKALHG